MDDSRFWSLIESAWQTVGGKNQVRMRRAEGKLKADRAETLMQSLEDVIPALQTQLDQLSAEDLHSFCVGSA